MRCGILDPRICSYFLRHFSGNFSFSSWPTVFHISTHFCFSPFEIYNLVLGSLILANPPPPLSWALPLVINSKITTLIISHCQDPAWSYRWSKRKGRCHHTAASPPALIRPSSRWHYNAQRVYLSPYYTFSVHLSLHFACSHFYCKCPCHHACFLPTSQT